MTEGRRRTPIEHAVDLFVYAPLGLLFEAPHLPRLVERGRHEASTVLDSGRGLLGRGRQDGDPSGSHAHNTLRSLGLVGEDRPVERGAEDLPAPTEAPLVPVVVEEEPPPPTGPPAEDLAIPEYESLSASQVVPRLGSLSADELEAVRQFELGNRHRSTILNKIAQLQES